MVSKFQLNLQGLIFRFHCKLSCIYPAISISFVLPVFQAQGAPWLLSAPAIGATMTLLHGPRAWGTTSLDLRPENMSLDF